MARTKLTKPPNRKGGKRNSKAPSPQSNLITRYKQKPAQEETKPADKETSTSVSETEGGPNPDSHSSPITAPTAHSTAHSTETSPRSNHGSHPDEPEDSSNDDEEPPKTPPPHKTPVNKRRNKQTKESDYNATQREAPSTPENRKQTEPAEKETETNNTYAAALTSPPRTRQRPLLDTVPEHATPKRGSTVKKLVMNPYKSVSTKLLALAPVTESTPTPNTTPRTFGGIVQPPTSATRYTANIRVTPELNDEKALALLAQELFEAIVEADDAAMIWPWNPSRTVHPLRKGKIPPVSLTMAQKYLDKYYVRPRVESTYQMWFNFYLSHEKPSREFLDTRSMQQYRQDHAGNIFVKEIQAAETKQIGWMLYSTPSTDGERLQTYFLTVHKVHISCRWRPILYSEDTGGKARVTTGDQESKVFAIHCECAEADQHRARRILQQTYRVDATDFPLNCKMRLVPHIFECRTSRRKRKANYLRTRQRSFLSSLSMTRIYGVQNFYEKSPYLGNNNLLEIIQSITNPINRNQADTTKHKPMFLSARPSNLSQSQLEVHYFRQYEEVATEIASEPYAFLRSTIDIDPDSPDAERTLRALQKYFFTDVIRFSQEKFWNPRVMRIIGMDDIQLDGLAQGDGGFDEFLDAPPLPDELRDETIALENMPTLEETHIEGMLHHNEVDSIGTFRTQGTSATKVTTTPQIVQPSVTETSVSTPTTESGPTFGDFLIQYGLYAGSRTTFAELDSDEIAHLLLKGAYVPKAAKQKIHTQQTNMQIDESSDPQEESPQASSDDETKPAAIPTPQKKPAPDNNPYVALASDSESGSDSDADLSIASHKVLETKTFASKDIYGSPDTATSPALATWDKGGKPP